MSDDPTTTGDEKTATPLPPKLQVIPPVLPAAPKLAATTPINPKDKGGSNDETDWYKNKKDSTQQEQVFPSSGLDDGPEDVLEHKPRTWGRNALKVLMAMGVLASLIILSLFIHHLKSIKTDMESIKTAITAVDQDGNTVGVMAVARDIRTNMVKSTDLTNLAKTNDLKGLAKKDDLSDLAKSSDLKGLAKTDDLKGLATTGYLRHVERKLDAHIATVAKETTPMPVEEKQNGMVTVIVLPVSD